MVNIPSNQIRNLPRGRSVPAKLLNEKERAELRAPRRPHPSFIPDDTILYSLIKRALDALAQGIHWDRGSIINILL